MSRLRPCAHSDRSRLPADPAIPTHRCAATTRWTVPPPTWSPTSVRWAALQRCAGSRAASLHRAVSATHRSAMPPRWTSDWPGHPPAHRWQQTRCNTPGSSVPSTMISSACAFLRQRRQRNYRCSQTVVAEVMRWEVWLRYSLRRGAVAHGGVVWKRDRHPTARVCGSGCGEVSEVGRRDAER